MEEFLPGSVSALTPGRHAELLAGFHGLADDVAVGAQPGRLEHLAVLNDASAEETITACKDAEDREWLGRRLDQARELASGIDWSASPLVLVHGDFARHNLLFNGADLSGVLNFELATVDRRVVDFIHVWRCRYDDVVTSYDRITRLEPDEWPMLLVDWWIGGLGGGAGQPRDGPAETGSATGSLGARRASPFVETRNSIRDRRNPPPLCDAPSDP